MYKLNRLIHVRWDIFHRAVNDVKGALADAGPSFLSAQMHSAYLWALPYRPFGSGAFMEEKKRILDLFLDQQNVNYPDFVQQLDLFRADLGLDANVTSEDIWNAICELPGFQAKGTLPKLGRWFSWNQSFEEQGREFRVFRMLLKFYLRCADNIDPNEAMAARELQAAARNSQKSSGSKETLRSEFSKLKEKLGGGMKLAYFLMSDKLLCTTRLIAAATRPTWTWYTESVKSVKSANDTVRQTMSLVRSWSSDSHLVGTAAVLTERIPEVVNLFDDRELCKFADSHVKLFKLVGNLLKHRAWSFAKQYTAPPDCYCALLGNNANHAYVICLTLN
eukprot:Skav208241  [mRNA]  locus=scaffold2093:34064:35065:+ [translate_table: standard]